MTDTLEFYSLVAVYSAMVVYTLAFIAYAFDLAGRSAERTRAEDRRRAGSTAAVASREASAEQGGSVTGEGGTLTAVAERPGSDAAPAEEPAAPRRPLWLRLGTVLTVIGFAVHLFAAVTRGLAAGRVPWANMYEFSLTATLLITGVFLAVQLRKDLRFLGTFIIGLVTILLGLSTVGFYVEVVPLDVSLQSPWLVIHVFVASLSMGFFALGFALSVLQLIQHRLERGGTGEAPERRGRLSRLMATLPSAERLEDLTYRLVIIGFIFWTFTLIAGAIWAETAWGRYWGWDPKEVWTFIIWVIYAGYIHARATRGWRGVPSAWLSIAGFAGIIFNYTVVNLVFNGLHSYSGL